MDDLIRRQAAIDEIEGVDWYHQNKNGEMVHGANSKEHQPWYKSQDIYKALKAVPAVDAVSVIRCKYCKHHGHKGGIPYCSKQDYGYGWEDNDFCSKGDRKDG